MRKWAIKRNSDNAIIILQGLSGQVALDQYSNDQGDGPYTLLNEITNINPQPIFYKWRSSWKDNGSGDIEVDMTKAGAHKMAEIRSKRDDMLKQSDAIYIEELSKAVSTTDIEADKAALRDMTTQAQIDVDAESDPDALEAMDAFAGLSLNKTYE